MILVLLILNSNPQSRFSGKPSCWKHCLLYFCVFVRQGEFDVKSPFDFQKCCNVKEERHLGKLQRTKIHQTNIKHYWKSVEILSLESEKSMLSNLKIPLHVLTYRSDFSLIRSQMKNNALCYSYANKCTGIQKLM